MSFAALFALLGCSFVACAFFSLAESSLFSLGSVRLRRMKLRRRATARLVRSLLARPRRLLITVIIGNIFALTAVSSLATVLGARWHAASGAALAALAATAFIFVFAETIPKTVGVAYPERGAAVTSPFLIVIYWLFYPVNRVALALTRFLAGEPPRRSLELAPEDIYGLLRESERFGVLDEAERAMIERVVTFSDRTAREIATPRTKIFALPAETEFGAATRAVARSGFGRIPVYRDGLEDIVGILFARDMLLVKGKPPATVASLCRPARFVPGGRRAIDLFVDFIRYRTHVALVVDEYGALDGLVTLSDVLGEIVGEPPRPARYLDGRRFVVAADLALDEFNETAGADLADDDAETVGGYLMNRLGRIPAVGEEYGAKGLRFVVVGARRHKITEVMVERLRREER